MRRAEEERLWRELMYARYPVMRRRHIRINKQRHKAGKPPLQGLISESEAVSRSWKRYQEWISH